MTSAIRKVVNDCLAVALIGGILVAFFLLVIAPVSLILEAGRFVVSVF